MSTSADLFSVQAKVNRVEVIDSGGRRFVERYVAGGVFVQIQDDGLTLKVFAGTPEPDVSGREEER